MSEMLDDKAMGDRRSFQRRKVCRFCSNKDIRLDYKDKFMLRQLVTERLKIVPRRISGLCSKHQRQATRDIKRARHLAILAYTTAQI